MGLHQAKIFSTVENSMETPQKFKMELPYDQ